MTPDDQTCLDLGREIIRLIRELRGVARDETGYTRRTFSFMGGEVYVFIVNDRALANAFDAAAATRYDVKSATPPSEAN